MTAQELQKELASIVGNDQSKSTNKIVFLDSQGKLVSVDYIIVTAQSNTLMLCHDDGMW